MPQVFRRADTGRKQEEYQLVGSFDHEPSEWRAACCAWMAAADGHGAQTTLLSDESENRLLGAGGAEITRCFEPKRQPAKPGRWW
jgi:hypothetical protein